MIKRKFIINPRSGKGLSESQIRELREYFISRTGAFDFVIPSSRNAMIQITRECLVQKYEQIIPVGGDGTLNAVVNGFFQDGKCLSHETSIAVSRLGTGSDYFRTIIQNSRVQDWRNIVFHHTVREVDVGQATLICNEEKNKSKQEAYFLNMATAGLSAAVVQKKNNGPQWIPSRLKYILPTVSTILHFAPQEVIVSIDGKPAETLKLISLFAAKGIYGGGGMKFGGQVQLDDGLFDLTMFLDMTASEMVKRLPQLYTGNYKNENKIRKIRAQVIEIKAPILVDVDGEVFEADQAEFKVLRRQIKVCFPLN